MLIYKIHNVGLSFNKAKPIIDVLKKFNEGKSAIWLPEEWAHVEAVGDYETTTVIYVPNPNKRIDAINHPGRLTKLLEDAYDALGGEDFLKEESVFIPDGMVRVEVLKKPTISSEKPKQGITLFKVKTDGMDVANAFELINRIREEYTNVNEDGFVQNDVYTVNTKIFVPDSLMDIEVI